MVLDNIPLVDKMERIYVDFGENIPWVVERREAEEEERQRKLEELLESMTPEERKKYRSKMLREEEKRLRYKAQGITFTMPGEKKEDAMFIPEKVEGQVKMHQKVSGKMIMGNLEKEEERY